MGSSEKKFIRELDEGVIRFRDILGKADLIELQFGEESYPWFLTVCRDFARMGGVSVEQAAGVVAVLLPMVGWRSCLLAAKVAVLSRGEVLKGPGFRANYEKARKILLLNDLSVISGPKILPFYKTLLNPVGCMEVVVDTHMLSAFSGRRSYTFDPRTMIARIPIVAEAVKRIASEVGWGLPRTQATLWITWKRITRGFGDQLSLWQRGGNGECYEKLPNMWKGIPL